MCSSMSKVAASSIVPRRIFLLRLRMPPCGRKGKQGLTLVCGAGCRSRGALTHKHLHSSMHNWWQQSANGSTASRAPRAPPTTQSIWVDYGPSRHGQPIAIFPFPFRFQFRCSSDAIPFRLLHRIMADLRSGGSCGGRQRATNDD